MRKKIDDRIRTLVENCVKTRHRSLFVIVGDKGKDQVVNLHYMLSKAAIKARPSVLWCYKKELSFSSHKKKRMQQIKKMAQRGLLDPENEDPFSLFVASTNIRYCYYADTHKVLGNTFGMCVLQDFEGLTPNLLARTIETVEGGGCVVMLLSTLTSLKQLFTLTMDVHSRLKTESHQDVRGRFNERLVLSLAHCPTAILVDDELNILPTSTHVRAIAPVATTEDGAAADAPCAEAAAELAALVKSMQDTAPAGALAAACRSLDQARAVLTFLDVASDKVLRSTVALTAARGRGKSASMGLAIAGAVALGYSNIFVTAPTPENLRTLFEFVFKGLDAMEYKEHLDYDLMESTNPDFGKAIVRVNIYKSHRQTIQYVQPQHHAKLGQAELLVVDEAAAIPLPLVKKLLGPYLVFLCSTVNGYEGTGRSLSLKLISQLRSSSNTPGLRGATSATGRLLKEVSLEEPIRYGPGDPVELWLMDLLCLNAADHIPRVPPVLPHPDECELFYVERDTLFSGHKVTEIALQRMMSLYVSSHYKNTPNDLLLLSDAPAHHLFVLTAPVPDKSKNQFPDILAVVQVALEGAISADSAKAALAAGQLPQGDMLPWMVGQQFQDNKFPSLSGARIVRIATHPGILGAGYGSKAVTELCKYYQGECEEMDSEGDEEAKEEQEGAAMDKKSKSKAKSNGHKSGEEDTLHEETLQPKSMSDLPPLFLKLEERPAEKLHYVGVSYGLTQQLLRFWQKLGFVAMYLRQTASDTTGEHTCIMLKPLSSEEMQNKKWVQELNKDFLERFAALLPGAFKGMAPAVVLALLQPKLTYSTAEMENCAKQAPEIRKSSGQVLDAHDLKRLQAYCNNVVDHHLILDLAAPLAHGFFSRVLKVTQSAAQAAILVVMGLQRHDVSVACEHLNLPANQVLTLFLKSIKKFHNILHNSRRAEAGRELPAASVVARVGAAMQPQQQSLDEELEQGAAAMEAREKAKEQQEGDEEAVADAENHQRDGAGAGEAPEGLESARLRKHAIPHSTQVFAHALGGAAPGVTVQIKSVRRAGDDDEEMNEDKPAGKQGKMYEKKVKKGKKRQSNPSKGAGGTKKRK